MQPERLKVAMVVPVGRSGNLQFSICLCEALSRCGADATLITSRDSTELPRSENGFRIRPILGGMNRRQSRLLRGLSYGASLVRLRGLLRRERFDIAHFQDTFVPLADAPFFKLVGGGTPKTVFTAHDPNQDAISKAGRMPSLRRPALRQIYRAADGIVVMSEEARRELTEGFEVPPSKVTHIAHGNYESCRGINAPTRSEARARLAIDPHQKVVLFFGSLRPSKGLEYLIGAFARLGDRDPLARLLIVGEPRRDVDPARYAGLISTLGIEDRVWFRPQYVPAEAVPDYLVAADLVALPYLRIFQSGVLHLAYTFGRPVVATRVGGLAEYVEEGKSGLLVPPADEEALAATILEMLASPERLAGDGRARQDAIGDGLLLGRHSAADARFLSLATFAEGGLSQAARRSTPAAAIAS